MATRWDNVPKLTDDVVKSAKEDSAKAQKGRNVDSSKLTGGAKDAVREAGKRASNRNIGRGGLPAAALAIGYGAGRMLDEETGVGKKLVDKSGLGNLAEKAGKSRDKVELSKDAKERLQDEELAQMRRDTESDEKARRAYSGRYADGTRLPDEEPYKGDGMKKGGKVNSTSRRGDGIAQRGKTKGKYL
jgi:hypothetical protein